MMDGLLDRALDKVQLNFTAPVQMWKLDFLLVGDCTAKCFLQAKNLKTESFVPAPIASLPYKDTTERNGIIPDKQ